MIACIDGKRFDGPEFLALASMLGRSLTRDLKPKCAMGYPSVTLVTPAGEHAGGFVVGEGLKLNVLDPVGFESWLRRHGLIAPSQ